MFKKLFLFASLALSCQHVLAKNDLILDCSVTNQKGKLPSNLIVLNIVKDAKDGSADFLKTGSKESSYLIADDVFYTLHVTDHGSKMIINRVTGDFDYETPTEKFSGNCVKKAFNTKF